MTTRRTTFTRTPFVITAFLAANLAVTGAPLVAMAEEAPQDNTPAVEQQSVPEQTPEQEQTQEQQEPETQTQQAPEQNQQAPEPSVETQSDPAAAPYEVKDGVLTITDDLKDDFFVEKDEKKVPSWTDKDKEVTKVVVSKEVTTVQFDRLFAGFKKLESVDIEKLTGADVDTAKTCNELFKDCESLTEIKLGKKLPTTDSKDVFPTPKGDTLTGKWYNNEQTLDADGLAALYKEEQKEALTWKAQELVTIVVAVDGSFTYDGTYQEPTPSVSYYVGDKKLDTKVTDNRFKMVEGTEKSPNPDYKNNKNAGVDTATVTVTINDKLEGSGQYALATEPTASASTKFTIDPRKVNVSVKDTTMVYDGYKVEAAQATLKPSMTYSAGDIVEADKDKVSPSAKFTCEWERKVGTYTIKIGDVTIAVKSTTTSADDSGLTTSADRSDDPNYIVGDKTDGTLTVTAADISNATVSAVSDRTYTGSAITPTPTVVMSYTYTENGTTKSGSTQLTKDTDYTLSYADNTQVGTATITIKGKGNFTGEKKVTFKIKSSTSSSSSSSTTASGTSSSSSTPSTADPTIGIGGILASGIAAFGAARFTRKRKN